MGKLKPPETGKSTGPKTPNGKANSSQNAMKHGCRARKTLMLADESPEDYEFLRAGWIEEFAPEGHGEWRLVEKLILNDWLQERAERQLLEAQAWAGDWTAEQEHRVELMERYKTTAERAFYRSWNAMQGLRKDFMKEQKEIWKLRAENTGLKQTTEQLLSEKRRNESQAPAKVEKKAAEPKALEAKTAAQKMFQGQDSPKKRRRLQLLEQWVEVRIVDGKTVTTPTPSNEGLIRFGQKMNPPPELVYRRFNFPDGVPQEYFWAAPPDDVEQYGGCGLQRMTPDTWLKVIEEEKKHEGGHMGPTGEGNLPRPREHGECDCPTCQYNMRLQERADKQEAARAAQRAKQEEEEGEEKAV